MNTCQPLWPLERYRVTAMLTTLPYNSSKSYCANTTYTQILFIDMLSVLKPLNQM